MYIFANCVEQHRNCTKHNNKLGDFPGFFQGQLRDYGTDKFVDDGAAEDDGTDPGAVIRYDRHGGGSKTDGYAGLGYEREAQVFLYILIGF